jgi:NitT/TauT family transport system substrate-binding protein
MDKGRNIFTIFQVVTRLSNRPRRIGAARAPLFGENLTRSLFIVFCLFSLLAGCSPPPKAPLRVGTKQWPGYEILFLARSLGFYENRPIRLVELTSATEVVHALRSEMIEAAVVTLDEALPLIQDGIDLKVVLVLDISSGGDALMARPGIETLYALRGKRVGVENTATGAILLNGALEAGGLTVSDINVIPATVDEHEDAYHTGSVDAIVTSEPVKTKLLSEGAEILFDSSQIPGRIMNVLVVHSSALQLQREPLEALISGWFQALARFHRSPLSSAKRMAPRLALSADDMLESFSGIQLPNLEDNRVLLAGDQPVFLISARRLVELMLDQGLLRHEIAVDNLVDGTLLPKEQP